MKPIKVLVTGKNGQLGSELQEAASKFPQFEWVFVDREQMDLSQPAEIRTVLDQCQPQIIINAGAYTAVDRAESEPELCDAINHLAVEAIGQWAAQHQARVVQVSTDYVFEGNSATPLNETHPTQPINTYGATKLLGEQALSASGAAHVILRTAWVYSVYGANFVKTMLRLMQEKEVLQVVNDQIGSPTSAEDLALAILHIIQPQHWAAGVYHYSNEGKISWYEFALAIKDFSGSTTTLVPVPTAAFPTAAQRPAFSLLDKTKIKTTFKLHIPFWKTSLHKMLNKLAEQ